MYTTKSDAKIATIIIMIGCIISMAYLYLMGIDSWILFSIPISTCIITLYFLHTKLAKDSAKLW